MATRPKLKNIVSPQGIAIYPKLNAPDTKFKADGEYSVKIRMSAEEAQPLVDQIEAELQQKFDAEKAELMAGDGKAKLKAKAMKVSSNRPYGDCADDEGEPTGEVWFKFNSNARVKREGKADLILKPDFFDASGKSLKVPPEIWGGSTLAIAASLQPYNTPAAGFGIKLRLNAVQIIELSSGGNRDAGGYGFGKSEGGYEGADEPEGGSSPFSGGDAPAAEGAGSDDF